MLKIVASVAFPVPTFVHQDQVRGGTQKALTIGGNRATEVATPIPFEFDFQPW